MATDNRSTPTSSNSSADHLTVSITKSIVVDDEEQIQLDMDALHSVLMHKDVCNLPVVIYSIAGPLRTGKSFLLTLLMRHLIHLKTSLTVTDILSGLHPELVRGCNLRNEQTHSAESPPTIHLHSRPESDLTGEDMLQNWFQWRGGSEAHTRGIYLLKEPFFIDIDIKTHRKAALFLMDSQGIFDSDLSTQEHEIIGALCFLMSSRQFFNLNKSIETPHFDYIYKFAKLAEEIHMKSNQCSLFQEKSLTFLVRDWEIEDYECGFHGGNQYLKSRLEGKGKRASQHDFMKFHFKKTFGDISCFLLPPPEAKVRKMGKTMQAISIKDIGKDFLSKLNELFQHETETSEWVVKKINGEEATCRQLYDYMKMYAFTVSTREGLSISQHLIVVTEIANMKEKITRYAETVVEYLHEILSKNDAYDKLVFNMLHEYALKKFDQDPIADVPAIVRKFRKGLDLMLKEIFQAYETCRQTEKICNKHLDSFIKRVEGRNPMVVSIKKVWENKLEKVVKVLKKEIDSCICDQCCSLFRKEGLNVLSKNYEKRLVTIGPKDFFITLTSFNEDMLDYLVDVMLSLFGKTNASICSSNKTDETTSNKSTTCGKQDKNVQSNDNKKISLLFDLGFPTRFGVIHYPTIDVVF